MEYEKISYTAFFCAKSLSDYSDIPYSKDIYKKIKDMKISSDGKFLIFFSKFLSRFSEGVASINSLLESRHITTNKTIKKLKADFIIELAGGLTPRGLEISEDKNIIYVDTDLKKISKIKKDIVYEIKKNENNIIMPLNALNKESLFQIGEMYKKSGKKRLAITHSGLWTYLTKREQKILRDNIKEFLEKYAPDGFWITYDIRPENKKKNNALNFLRKFITKKTKRPPVKFKTDDEIKKFMDSGGLKIKTIKNIGIINELNSVKKLRLNKSKVLEESQDFRISVISLK